MNSLAVIRLFGPAKHLGIRVINGVNSGIVQIENVLKGDIVVIQRDFCRDLDFMNKLFLSLILKTNQLFSI